MAEEKKSNLIEDVIKSRLNHPFIGTLIFSFTITNYDILLILLTKLNSNDIYQALINFKISLNMDSYRTRYPLFSTLTVPFLIEPIVSSIHQKLLAIFRRITRNLIENEENKVIKDDYDRLIKLSLKKEEELEKSKKIDKEVFRVILRHICLLKQGGEKPYVNSFIYRSNQDFQIGSHVSYSHNNANIVSYTKSLPYAGKIIRKIKENLFLVYLDNRLEDEIKQLKDQYGHIAHTRFFLSEDGVNFLGNPSTDFEWDKIIINYVSSSNVSPEINTLDADFFNRYIEAIDSYLYEKGLPKEKRRFYMAKFFWNLIIYPFVLFKRVFTYIRLKFNS